MVRWNDLILFASVAKVKHHGHAKMPLSFSTPSMM